MGSDGLGHRLARGSRSSPDHQHAHPRLPAGSPRLLRGLARKEAACCLAKCASTAQHCHREHPRGAHGRGSTKLSRARHPCQARASLQARRAEGRQGSPPRRGGERLVWGRARGVAGRGQTTSALVRARNIWAPQCIAVSGWLRAAKPGSETTHGCFAWDALRGSGTSLRSCLAAFRSGLRRRLLRRPRTHPHRRGRGAANASVVQTPGFVGGAARAGPHTTPASSRGGGRSQPSALTPNLQSQEVARSPSRHAHGCQVPATTQKGPSSACPDRVQLPFGARPGVGGICLPQLQLIAQRLVRFHERAGAGAIALSQLCGARRLECAARVDVVAETAGLARARAWGSASCLCAKKRPAAALVAGVSATAEKRKQKRSATNLTAAWPSSPGWQRLLSGRPAPRVRGRTWRTRLVSTGGGWTRRVPPVSGRLP